jgi:hypothetical protein
MRLSTPSPIRVPVPAELPPDTDPTWDRMIQSPEGHEFRYAAAGMLMFNLSLQWRHDPTKLRSLARQARDFFQKYQHLLANDIRELFG